MVLLDVEDVGVGVHVFESKGVYLDEFLKPIQTDVELLIVVEGVCDLIHDIV